MPLYVYECPKCKKTQEEFHGMEEKPEFICPECKLKMKRKLGSIAGLHFKAPGFTKYSR